MRAFTTRAVFCSTALAAVWAVPACAQVQAATPAAQAVTTAPATPADVAATAQSGTGEPESGTLGDIVVTAQRRSENIQRTSLAVTALSGDLLRERGVRDAQDLQNVSPSLSFADAGILKFANIRGVGLNLQSPTVVSGVATYRDGLFAPSPIFLNEGLFDISSVEVLRGPQGTFVGQNSTGGAIIQKSKSPVLGETSGDGELTLGNYNMVKFEGGLSLPITDTLSARIATDIEHRDSFYKNRGPGGNKPGRVHDEHGRITLLWEPTSNLSILSKTEFNVGDDGGYPASPITGTLYAPLDPPGDFTLNYDRADTRRKEFSLRTGLDINYTLGNGIRLRSLSGYQYGYQDFLNDNDASPSPDSYQRQIINDKVYSEEINIISPDTGRFRWIVGGTYVKQIADLDLHIYFQGAPFNGAPFPRQDVYIDTVNPKSAIGAFAQGTYKVTDTLTLELGGRYSHDTQTQSGALTLSPVPPLPGRLDAGNPRYSDSKWTGKASLNWQVDPNNLLYGFVANGFKSGGVNVPTGTFRPETIVDYEGGWKSTLLGGHLRLQVDGFYMDYKDLQLNIFNPQTTNAAVANAGASQIYGGEMQAQARFGNFSADANLSYVHSKVGQLSLVDTRALPGGSSNGLGVQCAPGQSPATGCFDYSSYVVDLDGKRNPYSPRWTINGGIEYAFEMANGDRVTPRIGLSYLSAQTTSLFERPVLDILAARTLLDLSLSYVHAGWRLTAYGTNVTNRHYRVGNDGNNTYFGAPAQAGVRIGKSF